MSDLSAIVCAIMQESWLRTITSEANRPLYMQQPRTVNAHHLIKRAFSPVDAISLRFTHGHVFFEIGQEHVEEALQPCKHCEISRGSVKDLAHPLC